MPFTPIHMGPGLLVKALLQGAFSLLVFGWTQVLMDLQPLFVLITGEGHLHGFSHTFLGASLIAGLAIPTGKYAAEFALYLAREPAYLPVRWPVATISAFIGAYSHVLFDSIMHADLEPFFPVSADNPWLGLLSIDTLHRLCLYSGAVGILLLVVITGWRRLCSRATGSAPAGDERA